jgi:uncharacterized membrane protein
VSSERGSVLLLVPTAVLVLVVLGAVAVDAAVVFLGQRELGSAVAAAANDAAAAAFADAPFYEAGRVEIDLARARRVAAASLAARAVRGLELTGPPEVIVLGRQLCVRAQARVDRVFAPAIPGAARATTIRAQSTATLAGAGRPLPRAAAC